MFTCKPRVVCLVVVVLIELITECKLPIKTANVATSAVDKKTGPDMMLRSLYILFLFLFMCTWSGVELCMCLCVQVELHAVARGELSLRSKWKINSKSWSRVGVYKQNLKKESYLFLERAWKACWVVLNGHFTTNRKRQKTDWLITTSRSEKALVYMLYGSMAVWQYVSSMVVW